MAGPHVAALAQAHIEQRVSHQAFRQQLAGVVDRVNLIQRDSVRPLREALLAFQEEAQYATSESLPGSEKVDSEMCDLLCAIEQKIQRLEWSYGEVPPEAEAAKAIPENVAEVVQDVKRLQVVLDRRERLMTQLR